MKNFLLLLLMFLSPIAYAQLIHSGQSKTWMEIMEGNHYVIDTGHTVNHLDLGEIWQAERYSVIGIIGENYQRLDIKYSSIIKDENQPDVYNVFGKSKVKNNVCAFQGTIKIIEHYIQRDNVHHDYKNEGYVLSNCTLFESQTQTHSVFFQGIIKTYYAIDKTGAIVYPDDGDEPGSNYNNGFVGSWTDYKTNRSKKVHWGTDFVPLSDDLNAAVAIGDFIPNKKYHQYDWSAHQKGWKTASPENWWK